MARVSRLGSKLRRVERAFDALGASGLGARPPICHSHEAGFGRRRDVLQHRHVREQLEILKRAADAEPRDLPVRQPEDAAPRKVTELIRHQMSGHGVEQRRLAGARSADQRR